MTEISVPNILAVVARKIPSPPSPRFAIGWPSSAVAADAGVPGILMRIALWQPPEIAPTYTPIRAISADCVGKLYVSPVSSAIAIVALRPGSIPISRPDPVARMITIILYG